MGDVVAKYENGSFFIGDEKEIHELKLKTPEQDLRAVKQTYLKFWRVYFILCNAEGAFSEGRASYEGAQGRILQILFEKEKTLLELQKVIGDFLVSLLADKEKKAIVQLAPFEKQCKLMDCYLGITQEEIERYAG